MGDSNTNRSRLTLACSCIFSMLPVAVLLLPNIAASTTYREATVFLDGAGHVKVKEGVMDKSGAAYGYYNNTLLQTGWSTLEVKAGYDPLNAHTLDNTDIMFAAGYLEGLLTAKQIWMHYSNMVPVFLPSDEEKRKVMKQKFSKFFQSQEQWMRRMIAKHAGADPYWRHVAYILAQFDGLCAGYQAAANITMDRTRFVLQYLNAVGDLIDLQRVLDPGSRPDFQRMTRDQILNYASFQGHCSALVKVTGAFENLYVSHSSWFVYAATMRIYKHYHLNVKDVATEARTISFSSYPGFLESLDDFYLMNDSQLVLLQTTNNVFNNSLFDAVTPQSMLAWQRVRIANMMATGGQQWYEVFREYNSGTYNNQYMIVDLKKVHLHAALEDDALWVVEQIPTLVEGSDQTAILRAGYWPSYNVPFYERIYNMSDYPYIVKEKGLDMSYQLAPRAKIFRRDQGLVRDMTSMKHIMRYNDYLKDSYSEKNPCNTICCRGDLDKNNPRADGCYDTKVSDYSMASSGQAWIINGPTLGDSLPPFSWTGPFSKTSHQGLPQRYKFGWMFTQPSLR